MMRLLASRDIVAGLTCAGLGLLALVLSSDYDVGTARRMGPGFLPTAYAVALIGLGVVLTIQAAASVPERIEAMKVRPMLLVTAAIVAFALLINEAGFVAAGLAAIAIAACAGPQVRAREVIPLALGLVLSAVAIFVWGLGLPLALWPR